MPVPYLVLQVARGFLQSTVPERRGPACSEGSGTGSLLMGTVEKEPGTTQETFAPGTLPALERNVY